MTSTLDAHLRELVQHACREAVSEALSEVDLRGGPPEVEPEPWRSRLHRVHEDTRLSLSDVSEALNVSERSVRRYLNGEGEQPELPSRKGPTGITVRAGDLRQWISDVEGANRFKGRRTA